MARLRFAAFAAVLFGGTATYLVSGDAPTSPLPAPITAIALAEVPRSATTVSSTVSISAGEAAREAEGARMHGAEAPRVAVPTIPTPLWIDAPYAALAMDPRAQVVQGEAPLPPLLDRTSFDLLMLDAWISMRRMTSDLQGAMGGSHRFRVPVDTRAEIQVPYRLPSLDSLADRARVASRMTTRYEDGLHLSRGDTVRGEGTLLVEGDLEVPEGASLYWDGLVLLHTDREPHQLRADLRGDVQIRGAMAVRQAARDTTAWQATLIQEMAVGLHISLGNEARLYYDAQSLRTTLDALFPTRG